MKPLRFAKQPTVPSDAEAVADMFVKYLSGTTTEAESAAVQQWFQENLNAAAPLAFVSVLWHLASAHIENHKKFTARLATLEARPSVDYKGTYQAGTLYTKGQCVTHRGSLWIALNDTLLTPDAHEARDWQLAVKRGRDGRDLTR